MRILNKYFWKKTKVFCIGAGKTGTTSLGAALKLLGYRLGNQQEGELLIEDWAKRDFSSLIAYCHKADAFQDSPFCWDFTFQAMDMAFPRSKFILTVRDSAEQWYDSLVRFHSMRLEQRTGVRRMPTSQDFKEDTYIYRGYLWRVLQLVRGQREDGEVYKDREELISEYNLHNQRIKRYFRHRPDDFLVLNVADPLAIQVLCKFLGKQFIGQNMPILNASK